MFRFTEPSSGQFLKQSTKYIQQVCTLLDPILFTGHIDIENHVKILLADVLFEMYIKTTVSIYLLKYLKLC